MPARIVVLGSINYDIVAKAGRLPQKGETVEGSSVDMFIGGKGSNQAVQAALLGAKTSFIGCVGMDEQGQIVKRGLEDKGVLTDHLRVSEGLRTGCASIYIDDKGDNMLVYAPGANKSISIDQIDRAEAIIKEAHILLMQNEINEEAVIHGLKLARANNIKTILNPAPARTLEDEAFKLIDYITPNETESMAYTNIPMEGLSLKDWARQNAKWFLNKGVKNVCITLGDKGSYFYNGKEEYMVDIFPVVPLDTTAAGDAFNGGFSYAVASDKSHEDALILGNACGALAASTIGAQNSIASIEELRAFLIKNESKIDL